MVAVAALLVLVAIVVPHHSSAEGRTGPREIRLSGQIGTAPVKEVARARAIQLVLPDDRELWMTELELEDVSGDVPGWTLYHDQFAAKSYRLRVVGPAELLESLASLAAENRRVTARALFYRSAGRLFLIELEQE